MAVIKMYLSTAASLHFYMILTWARYSMDYTDSVLSEDDPNADMTYLTFPWTFDGLNA